MRKRMMGVALLALMAFPVFIPGLIFAQPTREERANNPNPPEPPPQSPPFNFPPPPPGQSAYCSGVSIPGIC